jgi:RHS repeat-associated protein
MKALIMVCLTGTLFLMYAASSNAQSSGITLTLNSTVQGGTYTARDWILLQPGFKSTNGYIFTASTNEDLIFPIAYQSSQPSLNRVLDLTLQVGSIPGSLDINSSGNASYSIPLALPPGTSGIQPNLGISYYSQGGEGFLGRHLGLTGFSVISRTQQDIYNDGITKPLALDNNDRLTLDGQRLILVSGSWYVANSEYRMQDETFAIIKYTGIYFTVETPDGHTRYYGENSTAKLTNTGGTVISWHLTRTVDAFGNTVIYSYKKMPATNEILPDHIEYTKTASFNAFNKVEFYYENNRKDSLAGFSTGIRIGKQHLLRKISVYADGLKEREYEFAYFKGNNNVTYLSNITLVGRNGGRLNSTQLNWSSRPKANFYDESEVYREENTDLTNYTPAQKNNVLSKLTKQQRIYNLAEIDGDSKVDIVVLPTENNSNRNILTKYRGLTLTRNNAMPAGFKNVLAVDLDGDTRTELLFHNGKLRNGTVYMGQTPYPSGDSITNTNCNFQIWRWDDATLNYQTISTSNNYGIGSLQPGTYQLFPGDYDGSGTFDLLFVSSTYYYLYLSNRTSTGFVLERKSEGTNNLGICDYFICDYNGDRKNELVSVNTSGTSVSSFVYNSSTQNFQINTILISTLVKKNSVYPVSFGDVNNDGNIDIFYNKTSYFSSGLLQPITSSEYQSGTFDNTFLGLDHNADGRSEFCKTTFNGSGANEIEYRYYDGTISNETEYIALNEYYIPYQFMFADFNGDGFNEKLYNYIFIGPTGLFDYPHVIHRSVISKTLTNPQDKADMLINRITDGYNKKTDLVYDMMNATGMCSKTETNTVSNPVATITPSFVAVRQVVTDNGVGTRQTITYSYENARFFYQKGLIGFAAILSSDNATGLKTIQRQNHENIFYNMYPTSNETRTIAGDTLLSGHYPIYKVFNYNRTGQKSFFSYLESATGIDYQAKQKVNETYTYNTADFLHGNWSTRLVRYITYVSGSDVEDARVTTNQVVEAFSNNRFCRIISVIGIRKRKEDPQEDKSKVVFGFLNSTSPVIDKEYIYRFQNGTEDGDLDTIAYTYNTFGNRTLVAMKFGNINRSESYAYDTKGRFAILYTDPLMNSTSFAYTNGGLLRYTRDPNKIETYRIYDEFDRITETSATDQLRSTMSYQWKPISGDTDAPPNAVYFTLATQAHKSDVKSYYDLLGRQLRIIDTAINNKPVFKDIQYNIKGQVAQESDPYFKGDAAKYIYYRYLTDGRLKMNYYDNNLKKIIFTYTNNTVTLTKVNTGQIYTKTTDAAGMVVSATDPGGSISYQYYSSGLLKQVTAPQNIISVEYDKYGTRKKLTDPNAGIYEYQYNAFGEMVYQKDPKNNWFRITQADKSGRPLIKTSSDNSTVTYKYDTDFIGALCKVTHSNGTISEYTHDGLGRVTRQAETIEGLRYETNIKYNEFSDVEKVTYPSSLGVKYDYDTRGFLYQVSRSDNNNILWTAGDVNARGQWLGFRLGNSFDRTFTYNNLGMVNTIKTGNVQDLSYLFNLESGNLEWRKNIKTGVQETFTYDTQLDRLKSWRVGTGTTYFANYKTDGTGRFNDKTDAGTYTYNASPDIHQVSGLTGNPGTYTSALCNIQYTAFNKVDSVFETGNYRLKYKYAADEQRRISRLYNSSNVKVKETVYVPGGYEIEKSGGRTRLMHYIPVGDCWALYVKNSSGQDTLYFLLTDHLGSVNVITNSSGTKLREYSFDPWGRRRNPDAWTYNNIPAVSITTRGFTMHEHMDKFNLINMNGRVYDPVMGQFVSPDPFIQDPFSTQNFNRYSYCMGNPLKYVDPSGYGYKQDMTDRYNYEGGGFWYRGNYYGYDSENGYFRSAGGGTLTGSDYHYDWGSGAYFNRFGQQVSFQDAYYSFVRPNQSDFVVGSEKIIISLSYSKLNRTDWISFTTIHTLDIFETYLKAKYMAYPIEPRPSESQNTITNASKRDLRSIGVSGALAYPRWGKGISFGLLIGNGSALYITKKSGNGVMLSLGVEYTKFQSRTNNKLTPWHIQGPGTEMDLGFSWLGLSYGWAGNIYENSPYEAGTISGSWGMDTGAAIWQTQTLVMPIEFFLIPFLTPMTGGIIFDFLNE